MIEMNDTSVDYGNWVPGKTIIALAIFTLFFGAGSLFSA